LPIARFDDATNLVQELRLRKSPRELEYMRQAGEFSWIGLQASIGAVAPGRTDNQVVAAGYEAMISAGSELMSIDPIIFVGERAGWAPHNMYKRVPLKVGDATYMEYSGNYQRYNAPMMRSVVIGPPSDGVRRLADASIHTVELLIENIKPGRTGHDVAIAAKKGLAPVEDEIYFHRGYGYAVGLGFQPTWTEGPMYIAEGIERVLEPGMTFHLPMCIWVPGEYGVGFSETVVVTDTGCEVVTPGVRRELVVKP
jgi:Xaa-Pro aminopeptidase